MICQLYYFRFFRLWFKKLKNIAINVIIRFTYLNIGLSLSFLCNLDAIRAVLSEFFVFVFYVGETPRRQHQTKNSLKTARIAPKLQRKDNDNPTLR